MKKIIFTFMLLLACSTGLQGCADVDVNSRSSISGEAQPLANAKNTKTSSSTTAAKKETVKYADKELQLEHARPASGTVLRKGDSGDNVKWLQEALSKATKVKIDVDGSFGKDTEKKVKDFQSRCDLVVDGVAGEKTISALADVILGKKTLAVVTQPPKTATSSKSNTSSSKSSYSSSKSSSSSSKKSSSSSNSSSSKEEASVSYILNTSTMKFHKTSCRDISKMNDENKLSYSGTRSDVISQGYSPCGHCKP